MKIPAENCNDSTSLKRYNDDPAIQQFRLHDNSPEALQRKKLMSIAQNRLNFSGKGFPGTDGRTHVISQRKILNRFGANGAVESGMEPWMQDTFKTGLEASSYADLSEVKRQYQPAQLRAVKPVQFVIERTDNGWYSDITKMEHKTEAEAKEAEAKITPMIKYKLELYKNKSIAYAALPAAVLANEAAEEPVPAAAARAVGMPAAAAANQELAGGAAKKPIPAASAAATSDSDDESFDADGRWINPNIDRKKQEEDTKKADEATLQKIAKVFADMKLSMDKREAKSNKPYLYVGLGASPEILIRLLKMSRKKTVSIEMSGLDEYKAYKADQLEQLRAYFQHCLDPYDIKNMEKIVVLDFVSSGKSMLTATQLIREVYAGTKVEGQPIAELSKHVAGTEESLSKDKDIASWLNGEKVKMLTRIRKKEELIGNIADVLKSYRKKIGNEKNDAGFEDKYKNLMKVIELALAELNGSAAAGVPAATAASAAAAGTAAAGTAAAADPTGGAN